jgi:hypothetical protein
MVALPVRQIWPVGEFKVGHVNLGFPLPPPKVFYLKRPVAGVAQPR